MPTGYTSRVLEGGSFEEFALHTASAFSHLAAAIHEKGDLGALLPDPADRVGSYHKEQLAKAGKTLKNTLTKLVAEAMQNGYMIEKMIQQVLEYQAPDTEIHKNHKKYMLEQLKTTFEHDADPTYYNERLAGLKLATPQEWKAKTIARAKRDIIYHGEEAAKEVANAQREVDFIATLRTVVKAAPKP